MKNRKHGEWDQPIEDLKEKRSQFTDGTSPAIREETMRIRREDVEKYDGAHSRHSAPLAPEQRRGEWDG
jgi:hypothetical protein